MSSTAAAPTYAPLDLGDPDHWVEQHGDALFRFARVRVGDAATAEDLVQETLLAAWRGREAFDGGCAARTWLVAIMKRRIADHFRRVGRGRVALNEAVHETPEAQTPRELPARGFRRWFGGTERGADAPAEEAEFWQVVSGCTSDMPDHLARAFRLRTFGEAEPGAICEEEGISSKNLSVRLHRARQLIRRCLERRWFGSSVPSETAQERDA